MAVYLAARDFGAEVVRPEEAGGRLPLPLLGRLSAERGPVREPVLAVRPVEVGRRGCVAGEFARGLLRLPEVERMVRSFGVLGRLPASCDRPTGCERFGPYLRCAGCTVAIAAQRALPAMPRPVEG